ncbi:hypothetical protein [Flavobacterium sp. PS2]|uniref:hypothetical protein n=1 Tax=Flavobacterium sp. PS2 TaxID=3384157 RepID=UPI00390CA8F3
MSKQFLEGEENYNLAGEDPNTNTGGEPTPEDENQPEEPIEEKVDIDKGGKTDV